MNKENLIGPEGQIYAEYQPNNNTVKFTGRNDSFHYYCSPYYLLHKDATLPIPPPRPGASLNINLKDFVGAQIIKEIEQAGKIVFHSVGDTGLVNAKKAISHEDSVCDAMAKEVAKGGDNPPSFLFHLGDLVYYFGQRQYYYEQFYEPFSHYDRPIFAVAGNHDGSAAIQVPEGEKTPLGPFLRNFCSEKPMHAPDACGIARTTMTQPGVYFTLDAPFVSIIGLYSNCLEYSGTISSENGKYPAITDEQLQFLTSELKRLAPERKAGKRAIILATHAPLYSSNPQYGSQGMINDIESCSKAAGIYPDVLLAGHVHLYERQTITLPSGQEVPSIIAGTGGYNLEVSTYSPPSAGTTVDGCTIEVPYIRKYGYLTLTTDAKTLSISFRTPARKGSKELDSVTLDLQTKKIISGSLKNSWLWTFFRKIKGKH